MLSMFCFYTLIQKVRYLSCSRVCIRFEIRRILGYSTNCHSKGIHSKIGICGSNNYLLPLWLTTLFHWSLFWFECDGKVLFQTRRYFRFELISQSMSQRTISIVSNYNYTWVTTPRLVEHNKSKERLFHLSPANDLRMIMIPAIENWNDIFKGLPQFLASPDDFLVSILFFGTSWIPPHSVRKSCRVTVLQGLVGDSSRQEQFQASAVA